MPISYAETVTLSCPACGVDFQGDVWMLVDAAERPDLAQALTDGTLDYLTCPACGASGPAGSPLLYHDPARQRLYFAAPPDVEEHIWREQAQSLLYVLYDALPEAARLGYLNNVQVEMDVAGLRRAVMRDNRIRRTQPPATPAQPAASNTQPAAATPQTALLDAIQSLLAADSAEEFRAVVDQHPALLSPAAEATFGELVTIAEGQHEPEVAQALRAALGSLAELRTLLEPPPATAGLSGAAAAATEAPATQLVPAAYQRALLANSTEELLDAARDYPSLIEPWAGEQLAAQAEAALEAGNERLAAQIEARHDALAALRGELLAEDRLLAALRALLSADNDDARAELISSNPGLLSTAAQDMLFGLAAGARSEGNTELAEYAVATRAMLRQVRVELEG